MYASLLTALVLLCGMINISVENDADLVHDLPDYPFKGRFYSGYLDLNDALKKYHYLFVEAAHDPASKPLVLWLNGGPGCSSMLGWIQENGPAIFPGSSNKLEVNQYSWHKLANIIYLESPGNVGFSYIDSYLPTETAIDDEIVAQENFQALQDWFMKFPTFKDNDFYIAGESYAGIYIPRLSEKIIDYNNAVISSKRINFKGIAIGNGVASWEYDTDPALVDFAFTHSLYSYEMRKEVNKNCYQEYNETQCYELLNKIYYLIDGLNIYDLLQDCGKRTENSKINPKSFYYRYAKWAFDKFPKKTPNKSTNFLAFIDEEPLHTSPPCIESEAPIEYFNRNDVKAALHVPTNIQWDMCSDSVSNNYERLPEASLYLYPKLIKSGLKILIFSGDTDMAVPYNGNQRWIESLNLGVASPWRSWRAYGDMTTVAGYRTIYNGITFVTVKGTGHMVPQWKPKEAFYMMEQFFKDEDL
jgi:carboxypeptidase C (cathepsin A)